MKSYMLMLLLTNCFTNWKDWVSNVNLCELFGFEYTTLWFMLTVTIHWCIEFAQRTVYHQLTCQHWKLCVFTWGQWQLHVQGGRVSSTKLGMLFSAHLLTRELCPQTYSLSLPLEWRQVTHTPTSLKVGEGYKPDKVSFFKDGSLPFQHTHKHSNQLQ